MTWLLRIAWFFFSRYSENRLVDTAKAKGIVAYLRVLQGSRRFLLLAVIVFMLLQLIMLAGVGALVTAFVLWDYDFQSKMEILLAIFLALCLGPLALLAWALSESVWYRASGARKLVDDLRAKSGH